MPYVYLIVAIILEVIGTTFMKSSNGFTRLVPTAITLTTYALAFVLLSQTLKAIPTGMVYAIWSGSGIVLIGAAAWIFQGQKLDSAAILGMGLIVTGVIVMNVFSRVATH